MLSQDNMPKRRLVILVALMMVLFLTLFMGIVNLQLIRGAEYYEKSINQMQRTLIIKGRRGKITDRNGLALAYDEKTYDVEFTWDPQRALSNAKAKKYYQQCTAIFDEVIRIVESNGGKVISTFPIGRDKQGVWQYQWEGLSDDAMQRRIERWLKDMSIPTKYAENAATVYDYLRNTKFEISKDKSEEDTQKLLSIWQEVYSSRYSSYRAVKIAQNVSMTTVATIETRGLDLEGVNVSESSTRVYPKFETAAHILGYTGRLYDPDEIEEKVKMGYGINDYVGVAGVEKEMEVALTGNVLQRQGKRFVEINNLGKVTRELGGTKAISGYDVVLTVDLKLQMKLEELLAENIQMVNEVQHTQYRNNQSKYDTLIRSRGGKPIDYATMGAAVVMDVSDGSVLAMTSYPYYDPNLFSGGISHVDFDALKNNPAKPLFNKAISSKGTPGSIFKMVTALAGLQEGAVRIDDTINDADGMYEINGGPGPRCWLIYNHGQIHKNENVVKAIQDSCNYYFFEIANRLTNPKLHVWAEKLGLTRKTGIELANEVAGQVASQQVLYDVNKSVSNQQTFIPKQVFNQVKTYIGETIFKKQLSIVKDDKLLNQAVEKMMKHYVVNHTPGPEFRRILIEELEVPKSVVTSLQADQVISSLLRELRWTLTDTIQTGVGQSLTTVTPIGVARYISALVNGGKVYKARIVDSLIAADGQVNKDFKQPDGTVIRSLQPVLEGSLNVPQTNLDVIKQGMANVVSEDGTAAKYFVGFPYKIGGKTGTAQVLNNNIDIENNSWFVAFAPFDKPEIAVVVYIPNGYSGGLSAYTARNLIQYYMDRKTIPAQSNVFSDNQLIP